jgi:hypothetical protein
MTRRIMNALDQDLARGRTAHARALAGGQDAMSAAIAAIDTTFASCSKHILFKERCRGLMRKGPHHIEVWSAYQRLAERDVRHTLIVARLFLELEYRKELRLRDVAIDNWKRCSRPLMRLELLRQARVILRWIQRYQPFAYPAIRDAILFPEMMRAEAAE